MTSQMRHITSRHFTSWSYFLELNMPSAMVRIVRGGGKLNPPVIFLQFSHCRVLEIKFWQKWLSTYLAFDCLTVVGHSLFEVLIRTWTFTFADVEHWTYEHFQPCLNTCQNTHTALSQWLSGLDHWIGHSACLPEDSRRPAVFKSRSGKEFFSSIGLACMLWD